VAETLREPPLTRANAGKRDREPSAVTVICYIGGRYLSKYYYRAGDLQNSEVEESVAGEKPLEAIGDLQDSSYFIVELKKKGGKAGKDSGENSLPNRVGGQSRSFAERVAAILTKQVRLPFIGSRLQTRELMVFCRQFATMVDAGITILNSLKILARQTELPLLKEIIWDLAARVEKGLTLGDSFRAHGDVFPQLMVNMIETGEAGGVFNKVLERLAVHYEKQYDLEQKVRSATLYPKFLICAVILVVIFMLVFVLPSFAGVFESMAVDVPPLTKYLILSGEVLAAYWHFFLFALGIFAFFLKRAQNIGKVALFYDRLLLDLPLFHSLYRKMLLARFCRTLGTLLGSGVSLLMSLELVEKIMGNRIAAAAVQRVAGGIKRGRTVAEALASENIFPSIVVEMAGVGEETGKLDDLLFKSADYFESEVSRIVERLGSMLEPALILIMAGIIGSIALSVLLPMFEIYQMI